QASVYANTFAVQGRAQEKELTDMLPNVLGQLGSQSTPMLQKVIEKMGGLQALQDALPADFNPATAGFNDIKKSMNALTPTKEMNEGEEDDDDDVPDL
ncbi:hypothetical protein HMI56_006097, partial [Coelomomyces lativittatus]